MLKKEHLLSKHLPICSDVKLLFNLLQQCPRIDPQQLDAQIKAIMTEIIPVLKEHMDDVCSQQLLHYIRRLVLALAKHRNAEEDEENSAHEFVRFFHKQLASILQDTLAKFEGRKWVEVMISSVVAVKLKIKKNSHNIMLIIHALIQTLKRFHNCILLASLLRSLVTT